MSSLYLCVVSRYPISHDLCQTVGKMLAPIFEYEIFFFLVHTSRWVLSAPPPPLRLSAFIDFRIRFAFSRAGGLVVGRFICWPFDWFASCVNKITRHAVDNRGHPAYVDPDLQPPTGLVCHHPPTHPPTRTTQHDEARTYHIISSSSSKIEALTRGSFGRARNDRVGLVQGYTKKKKTLQRILHYNYHSAIFFLTANDSLFVFYGESTLENAQNKNRQHRSFSRVSQRRL